MQYQFSEIEKEKILNTLQSIDEVIMQLIKWNENITNASDYYLDQSGMQLLAANCTLFTAIGEGITRIKRISDFLYTNYPEIPWGDYIGMRNHIAHGYFELDAEIVFDTIKHDLGSLSAAIKNAIKFIAN